MQVGAVRQDRRGGEGADAGLGDADGADRAEFLLDHGVEATGRSRPYQSFGQCGTPQPESASLSRHSTRPRSGFQFASSQARTSARTESSVGSVMVMSLRAGQACIICSR